MKKLLKFILWLLLIAILAGALFIGYLTATEYNPADVEEVEITGKEPEGSVPLDTSIKVISWNAGYAALGEGQDFTMDGGGNVPVADEITVKAYLKGIENTLRSNSDADIYMLQEIDVDSHRSFNLDEREGLYLNEGDFALNYSCPFVPFPAPPWGKVNSGLFTTARYDIEQAERISLPCPFTWPLRTANLKRCLLASYLPVEGSDKELVIVNLHLEAYDSGEGKIAQTQQLKDFIQAEYDKGNYVIAGGDFNQVFPGTLDKYPNEHPENWVPGVLENDSIPEGWSYAFDMETPSCRLLNQPYNPADTENTQFYVIDGFIISPNVELENVETVDMGFENTDHNPVVLKVKLAA